MTASSGIGQVELVGGAGLDQREEREGLDGAAQRDDHVGIADRAFDRAVGPDLDDVPAVAALGDRAAPLLDEDGSRRHWPARARVRPFVRGRVAREARLVAVVVRTRSRPRLWHGSMVSRIAPDRACRARAGRVSSSVDPSRRLGCRPRSRTTSSPINRPRTPAITTAPAAACVERLMPGGRRHGREIRGGPGRGQDRRQAARLLAAASDPGARTRPADRRRSRRRRRPRWLAARRWPEAAGTVAIRRAMVMAAGGRLPRRTEASIRPASTIDQTMMAARASRVRTVGVHGRRRDRGRRVDDGRAVRRPGSGGDELVRAGRSAEVACLAARAGHRRRCRPSRRVR